MWNDLGMWNEIKSPQSRNPLNALYYKIVGIFQVMVMPGSATTSGIGEAPPPYSSFYAPPVAVVAQEEPGFEPPPNFSRRSTLILIE